MYGKKCLKLDNIIRHLNCENAYMDWIKLFPDDETEELANEDFNSEEKFKDLLRYFFYLYKKYRKHGLYTDDMTIIKDAHYIDSKLDLNPIEIIKKGSKKYGN